MEEQESQEPIIPHVQEGELYLQSAKYLLKLLGPRSKGELESFKQRESIFERLSKIEDKIVEVTDIVDKMEAQKLPEQSPAEIEMQCRDFRDRIEGHISGLIGERRQRILEERTNPMLQSATDFGQTLQSNYSEAVTQKQFAQSLTTFPKSLGMTSFNSPTRTT